MSQPRPNTPVPPAGQIAAESPPVRERPLPPSAPSKASLPLPPSAGSPSGSRTILVLSDTPKMRRVLSRVLRHRGYQVLEASDTLEAQRLAAACQRIHLLLMDMSSPEASDFQMALWFRTFFPDIEVLVASEAFWDANLDLGSAQHISLLAKPFTPVELAGMVRRVLGPVPR